MVPTYVLQPSSHQITPSSSTAAPLSLTSAVPLVPGIVVVGRDHITASPNARKVSRKQLIFRLDEATGRLSACSEGLGPSYIIFANPKTGSCFQRIPDSKSAPTPVTAGDRVTLLSGHGVCDVVRVSPPQPQASPSPSRKRKRAAPSPNADAHAAHSDRAAPASPACALDLDALDRSTVALSSASGTPFKADTEPLQPSPLRADTSPLETPRSALPPTPDTVPMSLDTALATVASPALGPGPTPAEDGDSDATDLMDEAAGSAPLFEDAGDSDATDAMDDLEHTPAATPAAGPRAGGSPGGAPLRADPLTRNTVPQPRPKTQATLANYFTPSCKRTEVGAGAGGGAAAGPGPAHAGGPGTRCLAFSAFTAGADAVEVLTRVVHVGAAAVQEFMSRHPHDDVRVFVVDAEEAMVRTWAAALGPQSDVRVRAVRGDIARLQEAGMPCQCVAACSSWRFKGPCPVLKAGGMHCHSPPG